MLTLLHVKFEYEILKKSPGVYSGKSDVRDCTFKFGHPARGVGP